MTERLAEVLTMFWDSHFTRYIEKSADTPKGVDGHPEQGVRRFNAF